MADNSDDDSNKQPYDESLERRGNCAYSPTLRVTQAGSRPSVPGHKHPTGFIRSRGSTPPNTKMMSDNSDDDFNDKINPADQAYTDQLRQQQGQNLEEDDEDDEDEDDDYDDENGSEMQPEERQPPAQARPQKDGMLASVDAQQRPKQLKPQGGGGQFNSEDDGDDSGSDDDDDDDDEDEDEDHVALEGAYDPSDYENLPVSPEIKELFQYIIRYTPQSIELEHKLKPFIPDFMPAVGDIDAFIKITRPDQRPDTLGLAVLDEPCAKQSDPVVLDLQLRAISKQTTDKKLIVKSLSHAEKNPKQIESWIESIRELHRVKPPPNVHYLKNMPDIETLMQEWPPEFEELLKEVGLPPAELDCDLGEYVDLICAVLDIPIYKNTSQHNEKVQALHVLFTLYSEFKNSQHFKALAEDNKLNAVKSDILEDQGPDQFVL